MKTKQHLPSIKLQSFVTKMDTETSATVKGQGWTGGVTRTLLVDPQSNICCDM